MIALAFNQDNTCLCTASASGFTIYSNHDAAQKIYQERSFGGASICKLLYYTSLVAFVGSGHQYSSPRRLSIYNTKRSVFIRQLDYETAVLALDLNKLRIVVMLEDCIMIYDINNMALLLRFPARSKLCVLDATRSLLAYTEEQTPGSVVIFNTTTLLPHTLIQAHKGAIASIAFNRTGRYIATCSIHGTLVRVFRIDDGERLHEFRRGTLSVLIQSLAFSPNDIWLACSGKGETVHLFKLSVTGPEVEGASSRTSFAQRDSGSIKLPWADEGINICSVNDQGVVIVASSAGHWLESSGVEMSVSIGLSAALTIGHNRDGVILGIDNDVSSAEFEDGQVGIIGTFAPVNNTTLDDALFIKSNLRPTAYRGKKAVKLLIKPSHMERALLAHLDQTIPQSQGSIVSTSNAAVVPAESSTIFFERCMDMMGDAIDELSQEQWKWQNWHRSVVKEQSRTASIISRKRAANDTRAAQGLPPLHRSDELTPSSNPILTKLIESEPTRIEAQSIQTQIEGICQQIEHFAGKELSTSLLNNADDYKD